MGWLQLIRQKLIGVDNILPQNKKQNFIFTLITALLMAYFMIVYNIAVESQYFTNSTFLKAALEFPFEGLFVFLLAYFVAGPIAKRLAFRVVEPGADKPIFIILTIQTYTVLVMVTIMSIYCLFTHNCINSEIIPNYIRFFFQNLLMAYPLQVLFVGPFVRNLFEIIFS